MHYGLPIRDTPKPTAFAPARSSKLPYLKRGRTKQYVLMFAGLLFLLVLLSQIRRGRSQPKHQQEVIATGRSSVVLVTTFAPDTEAEHRQLITENRNAYAKQHGYGTFLVETTDYPSPDPTTPHGWAKIMAVRHAMTTYPQSTWFFYLDRTAIIVNSTLGIQDHITEATRLQSIMIPEQPIVPPDGIIKTIANLPPHLVYLIMTQDSAGLSPDSFVIKQGDWARFFLDAWNEPLYKSYNFARAEAHALEHLVQWHGTITTRMAVVSSRLLNSHIGNGADDDYHAGDFVANAHSCDSGSSPESCVSMLRPLFDEFRKSLKAIDS